MASIMYEAAGGAMVLISLDATLNEDHALSATVTRHAVERGANITDHVRPDNDRFGMRFVISNTPIRVPGSNLDGAQGAFRALDIQVATPPRRQGDQVVPQQNQIVGASTLQWTQGFDRVKAVYQEFLTLRDSGTLVTIVTGLRTYENMAFTTVSAPRTPTSGSAIEFSATAVQLRIVETQTVSAPVPVQTRGKVKQNQGGQEASEATKEQDSRGSLLHNLFSSGGFF